MSRQWNLLQWLFVAFPSFLWMYSGYASQIVITDINALVTSILGPPKCSSLQKTDAPEVKPAPQDLLQLQPDDCVTKFRITKQSNANEPVTEDFFSVIYRGKKEVAILADALKDPSIHHVFQFAIFTGEADYNAGHHFVLKPLSSNQWSIEVCDAYSAEVEKNLAKHDFSGWISAPPEYGSVPKWCPWQATPIEVKCKGKVTWPPKPSR